MKTPPQRSTFTFKKYLLLLSTLLFGLDFKSGFASQNLDALYTFKKFVPIVIRLEKEPVYGEHVENELVRFFESGSRFEFSNEAFLLLKEKLKTVTFADPTRPPKERLAPLLPLLKEIEGKTHAVLICEILPSPENYKITFILATVDGSIIHDTETYVDNRFSLESFTVATQRGLEKIQQGIPFDGTIVSREGYGVVIDLGFPYLRQGMEISAYTIESRGGALTLEETGKIALGRVEEHLSFGKITVEKKPLEITHGNKVKIPGLGRERNLASIPSQGELGFTAAEPVVTKPTLGYVNVHLGASIVTLNNGARNGSALNSNQLYYPGGSLQGELWLTDRWFFDLGYQFAMTVQKNSSGSTNSNVNSFRAQLGYRLSMTKAQAGPAVILRTGIAKTNFVVDPTSDPLSFVTVGYSGLILGAGVTFPVVEKMNLGFDVGALLFRSVSESPVTSGTDLARSSAWDFALRGQYHLTDVIDIEGSLQFHNYSAEFEGTGTRSTPVATSTQSVQAFMAGLAYYF